MPVPIRRPLNELGLVSRLDWASGGIFPCPRLVKLRFGCLPIPHQYDYHTVILALMGHGTICASVSVRAMCC